MTTKTPYRIEQILPDVRSNLDRELYLIDAGDGGFSCLGFGVVTDQSELYGNWLRDRGVDVHKSTGPHNPFEPGTSRHFQQYRKILKAVEQYCGTHKVRCNADLIDQLIGLEGKRVEVTDKYGERRRFQVGRSTGFIPIHLELPNRASSGGPAVTGAPFQEVQVIW